MRTRDPMPIYRFCFGFQTPAQLRHWPDDEDSNFVDIDAPTEAAALEWGQEVAQQFVNRLFQPEPVDWRKFGYAFWLEAPKNPEQAVKPGQLPDIERMTRRYRDE
jgi:hypothetical protein